MAVPLHKFLLLDFKVPDAYISTPDKFMERVQRKWSEENEDLAALLDEQTLVVRVASRGFDDAPAPTMVLRRRAPERNNGFVVGPRVLVLYPTANNLAPTGIKPEATRVAKIMRTLGFADGSASYAKYEPATCEDADEARGIVKGLLESDERASIVCIVDDDTLFTEALDDAETPIHALEDAEKEAAKREAKRRADAKTLVTELPKLADALMCKLANWLPEGSSFKGAKAAIVKAVREAVAAARKEVGSEAGTKLAGAKRKAPESASSPPASSSEDAAPPSSEAKAAPQAMMDNTTKVMTAKEQAKFLRDEDSDSDGTEADATEASPAAGAGAGAGAASPNRTIYDGGEHVRGPGQR